jgi:hypothetical protein
VHVRVAWAVVQVVIASSVVSVYMFFMIGSLVTNFCCCLPFCFAQDLSGRLRFQLIPSLALRALSFAFSGFIPSLALRVLSFGVLLFNVCFFSIGFF